MWDHRFLRNGESLSSPDNRWAAELLKDGNLCVRNRATGSNSWCMLNASAPPGPHIALMQRDGNLCIYAAARPGPQAQGVACTGSNRPRGQMYELVMQDDGVLAIYARLRVNGRGVVIWSSARGNINPEHSGGRPIDDEPNAPVAQDCTLRIEQLRQRALNDLGRVLINADAQLKAALEKAGAQATLDAAPKAYGALREPIAYIDQRDRPIQCHAAFTKVREVSDWLAQMR